MLEALKKQVVRIAKEADHSGLCRHKSGNFSIRDKETGYIAITPTGISRADLTHWDICVVDLEANVLEAVTGYKPTSEILMHLDAYKHRPDIAAVVHTHSKFATAFAVLNKEIPAIVYEGAALGGKRGVIPVAPYGRPGTRALSESVIAPLQEADAVLLESHGVLTVDADADGALLKAHYVEEIAEIYYRALLINGGREPKVVPPEEFLNWSYPHEVKFK